jgi:hypothetical protein
MIGGVTIHINENGENKHYAYELHPGDIYYIARRWIINCGMKIPKNGTLFYFGGRALVVMDERAGKSSIEAIDAKRFWKLRYRLTLVRKWLRSMRNRYLR